MKNPNDFEVIANWWLNPIAVKACLREMFGRGVPAKLDRTAD
jgi:hypothetical protein